MAGVPHAMLLFNVAFMVVLASLLLQGTTIAPAARRFGVALPERSDERATRALFGDFMLDGTASVGSICDFYGLPAPDRADAPLGEWVAGALGRPPVVGDTLRLGAATLSVRAMDGSRITAVGLKLREAEAAP
jgi:cell volume regulation protein A